MKPFLKLRKSLFTVSLETSNHRNNNLTLQISSKNFFRKWKLGIDRTVYTRNNWNKTSISPSLCFTNDSKHLASNLISLQCSLLEPSSFFPFSSMGCTVHIFLSCVIKTGCCDNQSGLNLINVCMIRIPWNCNTCCLRNADCCSSAI